MGSPSISKSKFIAGRQCLLREWLQANDTTKKFTCSDIAVQGGEVGKLARVFFTGGVLVKAESWDFDEAVAETVRVMADPAVTMIFEAAFQFQSLRVRVDVLVRLADGWNIGTTEGKEQDFLASEVKASNSVKPHQIEDISYQVYVLGKCGLAVREATIMHLNGKYVYPGGAYDLAKLFVMEQVTPKGDAWVEAELAKQLPVIGQPLPPVIAAGKHCKYPYPCEFWDKCHPAAAAAFSAPAPNINYAVEAMIAKLQWPLYFLDFETVVPAVPLYAGMRPWQQVLTQYSCHIQEYPGGPISHQQFLHGDPSDPREPLLISLLAMLGDEGTVLMYSHFERDRVRDLAKAFPQYASEITALEYRWFDLLELMRLCFDPSDFGDSLSLKKTIQLVPEISYDGLAIGNGDLAAAAWRRLITLPDGPEKAEIRENLAAYCAVDTAAMVLILRKLQAAQDLTDAASAS